MGDRDPTLTIRPAQEPDAEGIARVHVLAWQVTYAGILPDAVIAAHSLARRMAYWREALAHPPETFAYVVAEAPAGIVGFACGGPARVPLDSYDGEIYAIYLLPEWQRHGLGRRLLEAVAARLLASGFARAYLWVVAENKPARRFYEALGGRAFAEQQAPMGEASIREIAYGWTNLRSLARETMPHDVPSTGEPSSTP